MIRTPIDNVTAPAFVIVCPGCCLTYSAARADAACPNCPAEPDKPIARRTVVAIAPAGAPLPKDGR